ncbi:MAG: nitroreductase/quinone reductase family protein [Acidimicrobiia bacterium]|jgi:deazaflavin-dependent oxidoreductase (nitroreductase family)
MNAEVRAAMERGGIADITTIGRRTGMPRRIEIFFHHFDGSYFLTGRPSERKRDWQANIEANPEFTLHLKRGVAADVPVRGATEPDPGERGRVLRRALIESWDSPPEGVDKALHRWVESSPFIRFEPV